ncbi:MAG: Holliday junction branch migration protein RuvA [Clostridia bacterium]|nr:Holliday junction branch migration protein RuvA [Clostridia bacterium]
MFYYIKGELVHKGDNFVVIDACGVGYKIFTSMTSISTLPEINKIAKMFTHLHIREDIMDIYGFVTYEELTMFENLISVSGVGPKAALSVLSVATPAKLALAVITDDAKTITKAAGVGIKLAQRLILELKDKLKNADIPTAGENAAENVDNSFGEAVSALAVLGYSVQEAKSAVAQIDGSLSVEEIIKAALKKLMK